MTHSNLDIRWEQRFSNYKKALDKLTTAVRILEPVVNNGTEINEIDELQREGLIHRFEYTQELAWKVMSDYAKYQGYLDTKGSRDAFRYGLQNGLIDSEKWMNTIQDRNRTSHTYNESTAQEVVAEIIFVYHDLFLQFAQQMEALRTEHY